MPLLPCLPRLSPGDTFRRRPTGNAVPHGNPDERRGCVSGTGPLRQSQQRVRPDRCPAGGTHEHDRVGVRRVRRRGDQWLRHRPARVAQPPRGLYDGRRADRRQHQCAARRPDRGRPGLLLAVRPDGELDGGSPAAGEARSDDRSLHARHRPRGPQVGQGMARVAQQPPAQQGRHDHRHAGRDRRPVDGRGGRLDHGRDVGARRADEESARHRPRRHRHRGRHPRRALPDRARRDAAGPEPALAGGRRGLPGVGRRGRHGL